MPGIYVRTLSQFDWLDQEKESLLTVPGSYWLCHKKNIYKFIFRYHRTMRNTMQFSYGRELLKIIRRIIKCHPTQGQQFGTQHLLVTYNYTSWTRQDKMFAVMKFQQQTNAATFSHAFVLTIKIFPSLEHSLFNLKYPIVKEADAGTTFKDLNTLNTEGKVINTATDSVSPRDVAICQTKEIDEISKYNGIEDMLSKTLETTIDTNFQDDGIKDSAIFCENLDGKSTSDTTAAEMQFDKLTEFHNNVQENEPINCNIEECEKNIERHSVDCVQEQSFGTKKTDEIEINKTHEIEEGKKSLVTQKQKVQRMIRRNTKYDEKYKISSSLKSVVTEITKDSVNDWLLSNEFNFDEKTIDKNDTIDNKAGSDNDRETTSENVVDSSNVPMCQHFEKKKIEDAKYNLIVRESLQTERKNVNENCVTEMIRENDRSDDRQRTRTLMNIDDKQSEDNVHSKSYKAARKQKNRESDRKTIPDKILRSSNITDLVMEGLMFTIRQDQDSIAVIEQKTKLEMDEVLENSEKVETQAGEKCLLNSSLLRLENLVTMIDSPRNRDEQHKSHHTINNSASLSSFRNAFPNDVHNVNINYMDAKTNESVCGTNYDEHNHLNYQSQWQHQCVSSNIKNRDSCSIEIFSTEMEKREELMEWQDDNNEQDKIYKNNTEMRKQEGDTIPEISSSKKTNAELRDINSSMNRNSEKLDKHDKWTEERNNPLLCSLLNPSGMSAEPISAISEKSSLIKLSQQETNVPRIVSNKTITIEQMPSALQKMVRHTRRLSSTTTSEASQQNEQKMQHMALTEDIISEANVLLEDKQYTDPNIANNLLPIEFTVNSEKIKSDKEKSCVTIETNVPEANEDIRVKGSKGKTKIRRTLRRNSSSRYSWSSKQELQDITEEFYYDLLHVHNKDNAIRQRCLRQKQRSLSNLDDIKSDGKVRIEMLKFIQDITEGAKVVVKRLNIDNKSNLLEKKSNLI